MTVKKLHIAIDGEQGSGKTRTALLLANTLTLHGYNVTLVDGDEVRRIPALRGTPDTDVTMLIRLTPHE